VETTSGPECGLAMTQTPRGERVKAADPIVGVLPRLVVPDWREEAEVLLKELDGRA
jgi:predicted RecA/RadA family phage recombinase